METMWKVLQIGRASLCMRSKGVMAGRMVSMVKVTVLLNSVTIFKPLYEGPMLSLLLAHPLALIIITIYLLHVLYMYSSQ